MRHQQDCGRLCQSELTSGLNQHYTYTHTSLKKNHFSAGLLTMCTFSTVSLTSHDKTANTSELHAHKSCYTVNGYLHNLKGQLSNKVLGWYFFILNNLVTLSGISVSNHDASVRVCGVGGYSLSRLQVFLAHYSTVSQWQLICRASGRLHRLQEKRERCSWVYLAILF